MKLSLSWSLDDLSFSLAEFHAQVPYGSHVSYSHCECHTHQLVCFPKHWIMGMAYLFLYKKLKFDVSCSISTLTVLHVERE